MVEEDGYCIDVLTQVGAIKATLDSESLTLLEDHMERCVADDIKSGDGTKKVREPVSGGAAPGPKLG